MATLKKKSVYTTQHWEDLGNKFTNYLKYRLSQDGAEYRQEILEMFAVWLQKEATYRITRYERADLKLVDEFIDYAWPTIKDPTVSLPPEPKPYHQRGDAWEAIAQQIRNVPAANVRVDNIPTPNVVHQWVIR